MACAGGRLSRYPVNLNLRGRRCVVIGGGRVAARKVRALLEAGAEVVIVSPALTPSLSELVQTGRIIWVKDSYRLGHLAGAWLAFAATDNTDVNAQVVRDAQIQGVPVNSASDPESGDFATPGVVRRGALTLTASTEGGSPTLSAVVREELERHFGPEWEPLTALISRLRPDIQRLDENARRAAVRRVLFDPSIAARLAENDAAGAETCARALVLQ